MSDAPVVPDEAVVWHDLECGGYVADLPLWRELAAAAGGAVLDVGAGTGRVALDLARAGHAVTALDDDPLMLSALRERAGDLPVATVEADARRFALDRRDFALCLVPMQTMQLLGGAGGRTACLTCARAHLRTGGRFAAALADPLEGFTAAARDPEELPLPDVCERGGWVFSSQPVAVRREGRTTTIERVRQAVSPTGASREHRDVVRLDLVDPPRLEREAVRAGYRALPRRHIEATVEHVGSTVVVLEAV